MSYKYGKYADRQWRITRGAPMQFKCSRCFSWMQGSDNIGICTVCTKCLQNNGKRPEPPANPSPSSAPSAGRRNHSRSNLEYGGGQPE